MIGKHINNALQEELDGESVVAKFATTAKDGKTYQVEYYDLDMIMSIGYHPSPSISASDARLCRLLPTGRKNHDRFLIIDDVVYLFGASLKDAGKKLFAYIKMQETPAAELLNNIK
jgi:hypothetical protein